MVSGRQPKRKRASVLPGPGCSTWNQNESALPFWPEEEPEEPAGASGVTAYVPQAGDVTGFIGNPNDLLWEGRFRAARAVVPRYDSS